MAMPRLRRTRRWKRCVMFTVIVIYGIIPALVLLFPGIVSYTALAFSIPLYFGNLKDPTSAGLEATRLVDLKTKTGDTLGLWHILPESALEEKASPQFDFDARMASGAPIFIYVHGSGGTRGQFTRVYTYTALRGQDWHVVAFDFRGFGDSSGEASEDNMVEDTVAVYRWVKQHSSTSPVFLWEHSLGSGVAAHAAKVLSAKNEAPSGLVLEAPFNNLHDLVEIALITLPYRPFSFFLRIFQDALTHDSILLTTDQHLLHVQCPTLILHAEDDRIVPVDLSRKLFNSVMSARRPDQPRVTMHVFPADKGYGHNQVNLAPDLGSVVREFVLDSQKGKART